MDNTIELFDSSVNESLRILKNGGVLLYPTDTVWGIGCDATDEEAIAKIYKIKEREESKSLVILVDSIQMLQQYIKNVPTACIQILKKADRPTTIVYSDPIGLSKNVIAKDNTVAIRIVEQDFCQNLIKQLGKPIVSTSANISGEGTPIKYQGISNRIIDSVDYIVPLYQEVISEKSSRILKLNLKNEIEIIRD